MKSVYRTPPSLSTKSCFNIVYFYVSKLGNLNATPVKAKGRIQSFRSEGCIEVFAARIATKEQGVPAKSGAAVHLDH